MYTYPTCIQGKVGVSQGEAEQHKGDHVVEEDDVGHRRHGIRFNQNPCEVGDNVPGEHNSHLQRIYKAIKTCTEKGNKLE